MKIPPSAPLNLESDFTFVDGAQQGLEKRKYRRVPLDEAARVVIGGKAHEGPCDLSRGGVGVLLGAELASGAAIEVHLPEIRALRPVLPGRVQRTALLVAPAGAEGSRTFHCFACGWTGEFNPSTRRLASRVQKNEDATFGAATRVLGPTIEGAPRFCPTCDAKDPRLIETALYWTGIRFDSLRPHLDAELLAYIENIVADRISRGRRRHRRELAEYVPLRISCAFASLDALTTAFLRDISHGGLSFTSTEEFQIGDEVRLALDLGRERGPREFVLVAKVVSLARQSGRIRYGTEFVNFDANALLDLRRFIDSLAEDPVGRAERRAEWRLRRVQVAKQLFLGFFIGLFLSTLAGLWVL